MTVADRLLPGEPFDSDFLDDVEHWLSVYEELTNFVREAELDLVRWVQRYEQRLVHWQRRHDELAGAGMGCVAFR
ncbi:MAG TPA: hypothetical protein VOB72_06660 [Candidatus Dormibacteraeota bacterium]|nr:hypothetical protein [Candidatus Dormibacteraeota bacterium]